MKIQNTEMEFVTFDAQDVIVTSGITDVYYLTGSAAEYNNRLMGYNDDPSIGLSIATHPTDPYSYYITGIQDISSVMNNWYRGTAITESVSGISSIPGYEHAEQHAIDIGTVGDYNKIIAWLETAVNGLGTTGIQ